MTKEKVLVTGGSGFVGRHLVTILADRGHNVRVLDQRAQEFEKNVELVRGSVLDSRVLEQAMRDVQWVFHLAADPNLWHPDKTHFHRINTEGTERVLEAAKRANVTRFVYTSTESILKGTSQSQTRLNGRIDEAYSPTLDDMPGPYCRSKFLAEKAAMAAAAAGLPVVVVNPTLPIGPGDRGPTPPTRMLLGFLNGTYPAYLESAFNLVDVRDVALGHLQAAEKGVIGERYILGGENFFMSDLLRLLEEISGRSMPEFRIPYWLALTTAFLSELCADHITKRPPSAPLTGVRLANAPMVFDNSKAKQQLDFKPRCIKQSLTDAYDWFANEGLIESKEKMRT